MANPNDSTVSETTAREIAQQAAEQAAQQASQQATHDTGARRSYETGSEQAETAMGERAQIDNQADSSAWRANVKRTYDEYQQVSLDGIGRNRQLVDRLSNNSLDHDQQVRQISIQALQNAVETANMVGKQAVAHRDLGHDRQWNVDEQGFTVEKILNNTTFQDAIKAAVAGAVNDALANSKSK